MIKKIAGLTTDVIGAITAIGGKVTFLELSYSKPTPTLEGGTIKIKYEDPEILAVRCSWHGNQYRLNVGWGSLSIELSEGGMLRSPDKAFEDGIMIELKNL